MELYCLTGEPNLAETDVIDEQYNAEEEEEKEEDRANFRKRRLECRVQDILCRINKDKEECGKAYVTCVIAASSIAGQGLKFSDELVICYMMQRFKLLIHNFLTAKQRCLFILQMILKNKTLKIRRRFTCSAALYKA